MKKFKYGSLIALVAILLTATVAFAIVVNRSPDATLPHSPELNQADYWGDNCTKSEGPFIDPDPSVVTLGSPHDIVVIKSATNNFVWFDTTPGKYGTPTLQDASHLIYCNEEVYEPCSVTIPGDKEYTDWEPLTEPFWNDWIEDVDSRYRTGGQAFVRYWTQNFYDIQNAELICDVQEGVQRRGQLLRENEEIPCIGYYELSNELDYGYPCFLTRNPEHINYEGELEPDTPWNLPERFDGTVYMQDLCNQKYTCDGWVTDTFNWSGEWKFVCDYGEYCLDCK